MPSDSPLPPIWLLGSSGYSAQLAGMIGSGFSFAHHFSDYDAVAAMLSYREHFKPSQLYPAACHACGRRRVCRQRPGSGAAGDNHRPQLGAPRPRRISAAREPGRGAEHHPYSPAEREYIRRRRTRLFVGTPATVLERLVPLIEASKADELMVTTMIYDHAARRHSYEFLAQAFGISTAQ